MARLARWEALEDALFFSGFFGVVDLYFKRIILGSGPGQSAVIRIAENQLATGWQTQLRLTSGDLLEATVWLPLILVALWGWWGRPATRRALYAVTLLLLLLAGTMATIGYYYLGDLPDRAAALEYFIAWRSDPDVMAPTSQLRPFELAKLFILPSFALVPWLIAWAATRWRPSSWPSVRRGAMVLGGAGVFAGLSQLVAPLPTRFQRGSMTLLLGELFSSAGSGIEVPQPTITPDGLRRYYQETAFPNGFPPDSEPIAPRPTAKPNVLLVILETASERDYPLAALDEAPMPKLAPRLRHALIAEAHLSGTNASRNADFSVLTSIQDGPARESMAVSFSFGNARPMEALPIVLRRHGYRTSYYFGVRLAVRADAWIPEHLGFEHIDARGPSGRTLERVASDEQMFQRVLEDLETLDKSRPFFAFVRSRIGHVPLPRVAEIRHDSGATRPEGRADELREIRWFLDRKIDELLSMLEVTGRLDNTVVVIVGDHGPRLPIEDPAIDSRVLNQITFHVPLVVIYPQAFPQQVRVAAVTTHIDIAPTILHLVGIEVPAEFQGLDLRDPRLSERVNPMFGSTVSRLDGLEYRGRWYLEDHVDRVIYLNDQFAFGRGQVVESATSDTSGEVAFFGRTEARFAALREGWRSYLLAPH